MTTHGVDGDDSVLQVDLFEKHGNGGDFIGLVCRGDLAQGNAFLAGPGADDMERPKVAAGVVRAATGLAVNRDETFAGAIVGRNGVRNPILKAALKGLGFKSHEKPANAIARGNAIG